MTSVLKAAVVPDPVAARPMSPTHVSEQPIHLPRACRLPCALSPWKCLQAKRYHALSTRDSVDFLWQDFPDIASKGVEEGDWVVNQTMLERALVDLHVETQVPGGVYVHDDHIKNLFELIFCSLAGYGYTIVHQNKRFGYKDEASWKADVEKIKQVRNKLTIANWS